MERGEQYIRGIRLEGFENDDSYLSDIPALRQLGEMNELELSEKVTFFVGENGTGKSTLLEAAAVAFGFNPEGGTLNFRFSTFDSHSRLFEYMRLVKSWQRPRDGFFLRAESYYNVASYIEELDNQISTAEGYGGSSPLIKASYGGKSLHEQSHGESFFAAMMNRFGGHGIYILDEPEAALSPSRQLALLVRINELVALDSQFIISTHSPIILGYPGAMIYELSDSGIERVRYEDTETVKVSRAFINDPRKMINILFDNDGGKNG